MNVPLLDPYNDHEKNESLIRINQEGVELFSNGEFEKAARKFTEALKGGLTTPSVYHNRGMTYYYAGKYGEAIPDLSMGIVPEKPDPKILFYRGISYFKTGKYQLALDDFTDCLSLLRYFYEPIYWRALIYLEMGEYDFAIWEVKKYIQHETDNAKAYVLLGNAQYRINEPSRALESYTTAEKYDSTLEEIYLNRAIIYEQLKDYGSALKDLEKAKTIRPKDYRPLMIMGSIFHGTGDYGRAISCYSNAINMNRSLWELFNNRGISYLAIGQPWKAIRDFDMACNVDSSQALPVINRAKAFLTAGMKERAREDYLRAKKMDPSLKEEKEFSDLINLQVSDVMKDNNK